MLAPRPRRLAAPLSTIALVSLLAACAEPNRPPGGFDDSEDSGSSRADVGAPRDGGPDGSSQRDLGPQPDLGRHGFLQPCDEGGGCLSGYCVTTDDGRVCTRTCNDDCPPAWECLEVVNEGGDVVFICMPERLLCTPCEHSEECGGDHDLCLAAGGATFCGRDCRDQDCPDGYACRPVEEGDPDDMQCVPADGWCSDCHDEDGDGHLGGPDCPEGPDCDDTRNDVYRGAPESCDGADNDCDGATDEDFELRGDPQHCGACGRACTYEHGVPGCVQGECSLAGCEDGFVDCDEEPDTGCERPCQLTHGGTEACDGVDNDCDCATDEDFDLAEDPAHCGRCGRACRAAGCAVGEQGYEAWPAASCVQGECAPLQPVPCGLYTCSGGGQLGEQCARACENNSTCVASAHCADGACVPDRAAGEPCDRAEQCAAGYCGNGFCCPSGSCCGAAGDCPPELTEAPTCSLPSACQGQRVDPSCDDQHRCVANVVDDDSACGPETEANDCGAFLPVHCSGEADQADPACQQRCEDDADCDPGAHCDDGTCRGDLPDGETCNEDSDCEHGHCGNGFCCVDLAGDGSTDCCAEAQHCPDAYYLPPACATPETCQGFRRDPMCVDNVCGQAEPLDDDRGCDAEVVADPCGLLLPVVCSGQQDQLPPRCPDGCRRDEDCDAGAHCDEDACAPDVAGGEPCDEDSDCVDGHCGNGFCCEQGDCCATPEDCPADYREAPTCERPSACQGSRVDALCTPEFRCTTAPADDDSACDEQTVSDTCGYFRDLLCTGAADQDDPACPVECLDDEGCDPGAHCDAICQPDLDPGRPCDEDSDCTTGHCANGFCCRAGDCCAVPANCPAEFHQEPACDEPERCQGTRRDATCQRSECGTSAPIEDDRACADGALADGCGLYPDLRCTGAADQAEPRCAGGCFGDGECDPGAHCHMGQCREDLADGLRCGEPSDCASGHCTNGFCCRLGDCCAAAADCPGAYGQAPVCERPSACQGMRIDAVCGDDFRCGSRPVDDDSGCRGDTLSDRCGYFADVLCDGGADQIDPPCPGECGADAECDPGAHCDETCQPDSPDGRICDEDSDCASRHCTNGFCCAAGDCCAVPANCPAQYLRAPACTAPSACEGQRQDATCVASTCALGPVIEDDRACAAGLLSDPCGLYPSVFCAGGPQQQDPGCADTCVDDRDCDPEAHCEEGRCAGDLPDGRPCQEDSDCASDHCANGFCCAAGDCCARPADCPPDYSAAPACTQPGACQGVRVDAACDRDFRCSSVTLQDDSSCTPQTLSDGCGFYADVFCSGADVQQEPPCPLACEHDGQCDAGAHCDTVCQPDLPSGRVCDEDSDCASGHCANGFCCAAGDCCAGPADCPLDYTVTPTCLDPGTCQGQRQDPTCVEAICSTGAPVDDDRGCVAGLLADECGLYPEVRCSGDAAQVAPACADLCASDDDCDREAHCHQGRCRGDLADGAECGEDSDCSSGHCGNGFCCAGGDCCAVADDCPEDYSLAPRCDRPSACQGSRIDARCDAAEHRCRSLTLDDDSGCHARTLSDGCGYFADRFCTGARHQDDPPCPGDCVADADCDPGAHCDDTCQPDSPDGRACDEDSDCISRHCANGFCCAAGDCCAVAANCPPQYAAPAACDDPQTCQGRRLDALCLDSVCASSDPIDDDRGCGADLLSDACGLYPEVYCTGAAVQADPACAAACAEDAECDPDAHCDEGRCRGDLLDGAACGEDSDCASGHCGNGFCCRAGDCCGVAGDCPPAYLAEPSCDRPSACQGSRLDPTCDGDHRCRSTQADDDSACAPNTLSDACGAFADLFCTGAQQQADPPCPVGCAADDDCDPDAHCDGTCQPDLPDGRVCDEDGDCASGHCGNGFCCAAGDCCAVGLDCPGRYAQAPTCDQPSSCQGHRRDATCDAFTCSTGEPIDDDRGCADGLLANECGLYPSERCTGAAEQQAPSCAQGCASDEECDPQAHCDGGACRGDLEDGAACQEDSDCASEHCANGFCCRAGDCCGVAADCPADYRQATRCEQPSACQGRRVDALCDGQHRCGSEQRDDDSACTDETLSDACGLFRSVFCSGLPEQPDPVCPELCVDDDACDAGAHCDGTCVADLPDGRACDEHSDCMGGHCANGFCCRAGDCCAAADDCPAAYSLAPLCDSAATCQGHRRDALCVESVCASSPDLDDDRGCAANLLSDECGPYVAVRCTGAASQQDPACPGVCLRDDECDAGAHCDGTCVPDLPAGGACDEASDCASGYCSNGFCCAGGVCCQAALDCPDAFREAASCEQPQACQGERTDAVCREDHRCATLIVADDSACSEQTLSDACGLFRDRYCTGASVQPDPPCPADCQQDADCDPGARCDGTCLPVLANGERCDEHSDCSSGHCQNGFCCADGDCCAVAGDCPGRYSEAPVCDSAATCQGHRADAVCSQHECSTAAPAADDRGCGAGLLSDACGFYPAVFCSGAAEQGDPGCPPSCQRDADCDPGAHCDAGECLADRPAGQGCDEPSDCGEGLACVDGVCCTSACAGTCERCDLSGDGTCTALGRGQDPDQECAALSCAGWFAGWEGDTCAARADLPAAAVACDGGGACLTAAQLCPLQPAGLPTMACHPLCQEPTANTCQSTTPGACRNVNPGTQSCGVGACRNTTPQCSNGAPLACEPLAGSAEVCNGVDDDCDGHTDAADADLGANDQPLCENQSGVCDGARKPTALCSGGAWQRCGDAQYTAHAGAAYQPAVETSCDGRDNDCDGTIDELRDSDPANCGACGNVCANDHGATRCSGGECRPTCDGLWGDCDGDPDDGCETALTSLTHCGGCGVACERAHAAESCATGVCQLGDCERGWANCDGDPNDGCEDDLTPPGAGSTCDSAVELSTMCGDVWGGFLCLEDWTFDGPSRSGRGERWYKIWVEECSSCDADLAISVYLQSPAGMDYDLHIHDSCGGSAVDSSWELTGQLDAVFDSEPDSWLGDNDSRWWYIRVDYFSGAECTSWDLDVCGGLGCP